MDLNSSKMAKINQLNNINFLRHVQVSDNLDVAISSLSGLKEAWESLTSFDIPCFMIGDTSMSPNLLFNVPNKEDAIALVNKIYMCYVRFTVYVISKTIEINACSTEEEVEAISFADAPSMDARV